MHRINRLCLTLSLTFMIIGGWIVPSSAPLFAQVDLSQFNVGGDEETEITVTSRFKVDEGARTGKLSVTVELAEGWHIYSVTQGAGGPQKSQIIVEESDKFKLMGEFTPNNDPLVDDPDPVFNVRVEYHDFGVTWTAPIELAEGVRPEELTIKSQLKGQRCIHGRCLQIKENLTAAFDGYIAQVKQNTKFAPTVGHVLFFGNVSPTAVKPGDSIKLVLSAETLGNYHIYPYADAPSTAAANSPTLVVFSKLGNWEVSGREVQGEVEMIDQFGEKIATHHGTVSWVFTLKVPKDQAIGETETIRGSIGYQTCFDKGCDQPSSVDFEFEIPVAAETSTGGEVPVRFSNGKGYDDVSRALKLYSEARKSGGEWKDYPASMVFLFAFLAGLILNIMPCVLPVIGIKIMSFVNQAGSHPGRLIILNVVFSLGIIAVFMVLATLAVFFGFGWGDLYKNMMFTIVMIAVLFVFALSFIGVWEIPIPGFVGMAGGSAQQREGFFAAFIKGVFTTLLATPCSGPMLVPAVVWAIAQPVWITYLVFFFMGLGMAAPYLLIGMFPGLAKMLPKPGNWMITFKVLMGFLLLGAVVFFFGSVTKKYQTSTLSLLVFLGMACWLVGHMSMAAELKEKIRTWGMAAAVTTFGIIFSFFYLLPQYELQWEPYSKATLDKYLAEGRPVFVDATADWCFTCKTNEFTSFNRKETFNYFRDNNIVALKADNTVESMEINMLLDGFGNTAHGLPYYAVYHPNRVEPLHFGSQTFFGPMDFLSRIDEVFNPQTTLSPEQSTGKSEVGSELGTEPGSVSASL